eukprot:4326040-Pleurochrysis_carterae.AAC.2
MFFRPSSRNHSFNKDAEFSERSERSDGVPCSKPPELNGLTPNNLRRPKGPTPEQQRRSNGTSSNGPTPPNLRASASPKVRFAKATKSTSQSRWPFLLVLGCGYAMVYFQEQRAMHLLHRFSELEAKMEAGAFSCEIPAMLHAHEAGVIAIGERVSQLSEQFDATFADFTVHVDRRHAELTNGLRRLASVGAAQSTDLEKALESFAAASSEQERRLLETMRQIDGLRELVLSVSMGGHANGGMQLRNAASPVAQEVLVMTHMSDLPRTADGRLSTNWLLAPASCKTQLQTIRVEQRKLAIVRDELESELFPEQSGTKCDMLCITHNFSSNRRGLHRYSKTRSFEFEDHQEWVDRECQQTSVGFTLDSGEPANIYWVNPSNSQLILQRTIRPGETEVYWADTMLGHRFQVHSTLTGEVLLAHVLVDELRMLFHITGRKAIQT